MKVDIGLGGSKQGSRNEVIVISKRLYWESICRDWLNWVQQASNATGGESNECRVPLQMGPTVYYITGIFHLILHKFSFSYSKSLKKEKKIRCWLDAASFFYELQFQKPGCGCQSDLFMVFIPKVVWGIYSWHKKCYMYTSVWRFWSYWQSKGW